MVEYGVIYKYTFDNGKCYIGQTINFKKRINDHKNNQLNRDFYFYRALRKYGFDSSKFLVIDIAFSKEELNEKEKYYIIFYESTNRKNGYNSKDGGSSGKPTKETKKKDVRSCDWKNSTKEIKEKISKTLKEKYKSGEIISNSLGKKLSEKRKKEISDVNKGNTYRRGKTHTEEAKEKMRKSSIGQIAWNKNKGKPILCIENNTIYNGIGHAARELNLHKR